MISEEDGYEDVPQDVLWNVLENPPFNMNIETGPAGDTHFDYEGRTTWMWGWDFGQAMVPFEAIDNLCGRLGIKTATMYAEIRKHAH